MSDLPDPRNVKPVKAVRDFDGEDWLVGWGNSQIDGGDWFLCTDHVRASELIDADFPVDAKIDAEFMANLINAYREGRLVETERKVGRK